MTEVLPICSFSGGNLFACLKFATQCWGLEIDDFSEKHMSHQNEGNKGCKIFFC